MKKRVLFFKFIVASALLLALPESGALFAHEQSIQSRLVILLKNEAIPPSKVSVQSQSAILLKALFKTPRAQRYIHSIKPLLPPMTNSGVHSRVHRSLKKDVRASSFWKELERTVVVQLSTGANVQEALSIFNNDAAVEKAQVDVRVYRQALPNDPQFSSQWFHRNTGQAGSQDSFDPASGTAGRDIDAELGWNVTTGNSNVVVAVIDFGVNWGHPDLAANIWNNANEIASNGIDDDGNGFVDDTRGWDFGADDNNPEDNCVTSDPNDDPWGHGTHVAGLIGAVGDNGIGGSGVAWNVSLMPLKGADNQCAFFLSDGASAIAYAANNGADVINMSWGAYAQLPALEAAINAAAAAGVILVAASGNDSLSTQMYPAAYDNVLAVSATDRNDQRFVRSNFGSWVDLTAPGVALWSTFPISMGSYGYLSGTSMASPIVSGIVALVWSVYPGLSRSSVISRIIDSCEDISSLNPNYSRLLGSGRINLPRALMAISMVSPGTSAQSLHQTFTLSGTSFVPGMSVELRKTGQTSLVASSVQYISSSTITADVDLSVVPVSGYWDVAAKVGRTEKVLSEAVYIETIQLLRVSPSSSPASVGVIDMSLEGLLFDSSMSVSLSLPGQTNIQSSTVNVVSATQATARFDISSAVRGRWDVIVTKGLASFTLNDAFLIDRGDHVVVYPNPFRSDRAHQYIRFDFLDAGSRVRIYDLAGTLLRDLTDDDSNRLVEWDTQTDDGKAVGSGIYFYLVTSPVGPKSSGRLGVVR